MLEYLVETTKLFLEVCHSQYYEERWPINFIHGNTSPFFSKFYVFNDLLGVTEIIS